MLTIDIDRKLKSTFFRMYSLDSFELIFECELYYGFEEYIWTNVEIIDKLLKHYGHLIF